MHFSRPTRANYYDCDCNSRLKMSAAMRYMQQTSSEHLEAIDMSPAKLYEQNMVFLLSKMCIKVHDMPRVSEDLVVGTAATKTQGARFVREFVIDSPSGERMVSALSLWLLVDPVTRKILRPASFPYPLPFVETLIHGEIGDIPIPKLPGEGETLHTSVDVRYSHIDTNSHVNNSVYADFVCDALPLEQLAGQGIDTLVISFQNEAKWGDTVDITANRLSKREFYVFGQHNALPCFEALAILK